MIKVPKKVVERLNKEVGQFQKILKAAKDRDINESDTVTIVTDMLANVFGFDKYSDVTRECAIQGTYCDLAIKLDSHIKYLIEVKAIGLDLKENHLRQAVNYGANKGIRWVVLTNGIDWEIYWLKFESKVDYDLVCSFNFLELNAKRHEDQSKLFILCKKGIRADAMEQYGKRVQSVNRYMIGALILTEPVINTIRLTLKKISPSIKVTNDEIENILSHDVLKRDIREGEIAGKAKSRVNKILKKHSQKRKAKQKDKNNKSNDSKSNSNEVNHSGNKSDTNPVIDD
ncbi:MAG: type I restriction enzyme HsdR N-terminal domain-containing protein [candidate division Zixibacteria bacterium]|nr:type I restriction enzyme HsdR N-terminal domain-containing protein [candidate division Zixibacteria bacterium]